MKWPFTKDGPGRPVSPAGSWMTVAPSGPVLLRGTIRTESLRGLLFLSSRETTRTQWRMGGFPRLAVQISPRRGIALLFKINPRRTLGKRCFEPAFLCSFLVSHVCEIRCGISCQALAIFDCAKTLDGEVDCLGKSAHLTSLDQAFQVSERYWGNRSGYLLSPQPGRCRHLVLRLSGIVSDDYRIALNSLLSIV